ncbi:MAG: hypothetical protein AB7S86_09115 [Hydrogenophaga sp.]|uniref:hypothetical protein n=1 Tax=Hydrogenophaga sp. TaxID=1904254 RepID=UPI003D12E146
MNAKKLEQLMTSYLQGLDDSTLNALYTSGACIWVDSGDYEFYMTRGSDEWSARGEMAQRMSHGYWMQVSIHFDIHEEHPWDKESKVPVGGWTPGAAWIRAQLLDFVEVFVEELMLQAESLEEGSPLLQG